LLESGISTLAIFFDTWDGSSVSAVRFLDDVADTLRRMPRTSRRDDVLVEALAVYARLGSKFSLYQSAARLLAEADDLVREDGAIQARIILDLAHGTFLGYVGKHTNARAPYLDRARALLGRYPDRYLETEVLTMLGWSHLLEAGGWYPGGDRSHLDLGLRYQEQALVAARQTGNPYNIAFAMMSRAICIASKDYREGKRAFRECITYCKRTGQRARLAAVLGMLGAHYASHYVPGEQKRALTCYKVALAIADALGHSHEKILPTSNMAVFLLEKGEFAAARQCRMAQLRLIDEDGDPRLGTLLNLAEIDLLDGQYTSARMRLEQARSLAHEDIHIHPETAAETNRLAAEIALYDGQLDVAEAHLPLGIAPLHQTIRAQYIAEEKRLMGALAFARGDVGRARHALRQACDTALHEKPPDERVLFLQMARARTLLSQIEREQGNTAESCGLIREVLEAGRRFLSDSIVLMGLVQVAHHVTPLQAVELASLVRAHRRGYGFSREHAAHLLETLKGEVSIEAFAAAAESGRALDLAQTAQAALDWLETQVADS
jgi:tetratricopeptide (TPR) repeat protein